MTDHTDRPHSAAGALPGTAGEPRTPVDHHVAVPRDIASPLSAGFVTAVVGFSSSFILVLQGLEHVGASPTQALSGLIAVTLAFSVGMVWLAARTRVPMTMAWSTPGSALLMTTAAPEGGFPAAVGAFILCAALVALTSVVKPLERFVLGLPTSLTQGLLAGILIPICVAPFAALATSPVEAGAMLAVYGIMLLVAPRWSVPAVLVVALGLSVRAFAASGEAWAWRPPVLEFTAPTFDLQSALSIGVSLFIVTMAAQNLPGIGVLRSFGENPPWKASMVVCGATSAASALFGGHATNLSSLSAAIAVGEMSGKDPRTRWWATPAAAVVYVILALAAGSLVALMSRSPAGVVASLAGLALLPTFTTTARAALTDPAYAGPNAVVILIGASGLTVAGFSGAVFAFLAGLVLHGVVRRRLLAAEPKTPVAVTE